MGTYKIVITRKDLMRKSREEKTDSASILERVRESKGIKKYSLWFDQKRRCYCGEVI